MMARWTLFGSVANLAGPLLVAGGLALGLGWRWAFYLLAALLLLLILATLPRAFPRHPANHQLNFGRSGLRALWQNLLEALKSPGLLRWVALLHLSDLLLDTLTGYTPLYLTDVIGVTPAVTGLLLSVMTFAGLLSDIVLIPLLERLPGRNLVRASALVSLLVYSGILLAPWAVVKIALLTLLRLTTLGWYSVLQAEAYAAAPGRSGAVMAISSCAGLAGGFFTWAIGLVANQAGLPAALWLLMLGPISLLLGVPRPAKGDTQR
jgi:FSR family fosmidomycin resistance protein-like MFS transporter